MKRTKKPKGTKKTYKCFSCGQIKFGSQIARHGQRKDGSTWHLCHKCRDAYKAEREMDKQAYRDSQGDMRVGEKGSERMGWNGIPSDRSLKARHR